MKKSHTLLRGFMLVLVLVSLINPSTIDLAQAAAPAVVTKVVPVAASEQVTLTWSNPATATFTGTMVRYSTSSFPTSVSDGTLAADVAGAVSGTSSVTVTGLSNGTIYYFSLFSHNAVPEYSAAVNAQQLVMNPVFTDDFESLSLATVHGQNGWNVVQGTWNVIDTAGEQTIQSGSDTLSFDKYRALNGGDGAAYSNQMLRVDWKGSTTALPGQIFLRSQSSNADAGGYFLWANAGQLRISYKTSTGATFTTLAFSAFSPVAGTWYTYEFSAVNNELGQTVLSGYVWTRGNAKPSTPNVQYTDTFNRFSQGVFSLGKTNTTLAEYDNVKFYGVIGDSDVSAVPGDTTNSLSWTNSSDAAYAGTMIRYSTSAYPTSITDGTLLASVTGSAGATSSRTHSGLTNGTQYYYTLFPYDNVGAYGVPSYVSQVPYPLLLSDDFTTSTVATLSGQNSWSLGGGTWAAADLSSNRVASGTASSTSFYTNKLMNGSVDTGNQILRLKYQSDNSTNNAGQISLRQQSDTPAAYLFWHNGNTWTLSLTTPESAITTLSTSTNVPPQEASVWFNVEASAIDNGSGQAVLRLFVWKEGTDKPLTPLIEYTDTSATYTRGGFALGKSNSADLAYYDEVGFYGESPNVVITAPAADVSGEPNVATISVTDEGGTFYVPYIQTSTTLNVAATSTDIPVGGGLEFVLNEGLDSERTIIDLTAPYTGAFTGLAKGTYVLDVYTLQGDGVTRFLSSTAHASRTDIGIGDIISVIGDSIVEGNAGTSDTGVVTSWLDGDAGTVSADHRQFPQHGPVSLVYKESFLTDLNDKLSSYYGYPVFLMNEGRSGVRASNYASLMMTSAWQERELGLAPNKWLVSLGVNDAQANTDPSVYQSNLTALMNTLIDTYGADPSEIYLAYPNYDFRPDCCGGLSATHLATFLPVIDTVRNELGLADGPDLFHQTYFYKLVNYVDNVHPSATGYVRMARLWALALLKTTVSPTPAGRQVTLNWSNLSSLESTIAGYVVSYGTDPNNLDQSVTLGNVTTTTLSNLLWDTTYYYSVRAFDNDPYAAAYTRASVQGSASTELGTSVATVSAVSGPTTEEGGTATFTVVLSSQPTDSVVIPVSSSDTTEGTVAPASLTFTTGNWNVPQTVTITGIDDVADDGDVDYTIVLGAMSTSDVTYNGVDPSDVSVSNTDNDVGVVISPGALVSAITGATTEVGGTATFTVALSTEPTADVTIDVSSSDTTEGTVLPSSLTFTPLNWDTPQTVTVTGANDAIDDGNVSYSIVLGAAVSEDLVYSGINPSDVSVSNTDNDTAGITITDISGDTTEAGATATFTIVFDSQPISDAGIDVSSSDTSEGTVSPSGVVFTALNWATPQTVTVTGVDDDIDDGNVGYSVIISGVDCDDPSYGSRNPSDITLSNIDNDDYGAVVTGISGNTTEAGGTATFTVVLYSEPTADVTIPVSSSDTSEGTVSPSSLIFTALNWDTPQTVTVTGVNDTEDDGDVAYSVVLGAVVSDDGNYEGLDLENVSLSTLDDGDAPAPSETGGSTIPHIVAPVTPPVVAPETPSNLPELTPEQQQVVETNLQTLEVSLPQDWSGDYLQNLVQDNAVMDAARQESTFHTVLVNMFEQPHFGIERAEALEFLLVVSGTDITDLNVNSESSYSDVGADYLRAIYIEYATEHDLVGGYSDGRFDPERVMNRAEALKMVANFFGMEVDTTLRGEMLLKTYELSENPFTDADLEAWYAPYLIALYSKGVVQGYADGHFGPAESISNSELLKMATVVQAL